MLIYNIPRPKKQTSWRGWGGLQTEADIDGEINRITGELDTLARTCGFPLQVKPVARIRNVEEASRVRDASDYEVPILYAASASGDVLEAAVSDRRDNLIFLRHRSGPVYLWYEIIHNRFLRKGGQAFELDTYRYPAGMDVHDIVVDDQGDLALRLRSLFSVNNFRGQRIVTLGGSSGWCCPMAPDVARAKFQFDMRDVSYDDLGMRIQTLRKDKKRMSQAEKWTEKYLSIASTTLHTDRQFVVNAFLLYSLFKEMMAEQQTNAFTIQHCMGTVMPISETTACLPLSLLNDEGYLAFCESDFNVIPSGILLHYISGKPVFLNDPTFPHHGMVTVAHCTAPRRMDGKHYDTAKVMTHFESDYGATPKVEVPIGTKVTMVCPDSGQKEWLGFTGTVQENPFYDICRSQYDIQIDGNWEKLLLEHRGFHWMMAFGDHMKELAYACPKIGVNWVGIT